ncbi:hypothetical protein ACWJJH_02300 [Endozoicomonadaceae bacterium StTr2]
MTSHRVVRLYFVIMFGLLLPLQTAADPTLERINTIFSTWEEHLSSIDMMVFVADLDRSLDQPSDSELDQLCTENPSIDYRTFFFHEFIKRIASRSDCIVIYNTARPLLPFDTTKNLEQRFDMLKQDASIDQRVLEAFKQKVTGTGINLNESPETTPIGEPEEWLLFRKLEEQGARYLPKPDVLVTGCGSFIQVGNKLQHIISPEDYNQAVKSWSETDESHMPQLHGYWQKTTALEVLPVIITTPRFSMTGFWRDDALGNSEAKSQNLDGCLPSNCLLTWKGLIPEVQLIPVQNMSINKGYAVHWLLQQLMNKGFIRQDGKNAISVCGDSESDISMIRLDLGGTVLEPLPPCTTTEVNQLLQERLQTIGITPQAPEWMTRAWFCSVLPAHHTLSAEMVKASDKIQIVTDTPSGAGHDGTLSMFEIMMKRLGAHCKMLSKLI